MKRRRRNDKEKATAYFVAAYYGDIHKLKAALKLDWHAVQYAWEVFTDALCKHGEITQEQYESWLFPWPKRR